MGSARPTLVALQRTLGYKFTDKALLERALTHSSARGTKKAGDNERLEFLGDRVLGLAIAELLSERHPKASEGDLARLFNRLVQRETCADVAIAMKLGEHLVLSGSEVSNGGRSKASILADACEAVLGAAFLDAGFEPSREIVRKFWMPRLESSAEAPGDPKTALQEWAQARKLGLPVYSEVERSGPDHAPVFTSQVLVGKRAPATGSGSSKRVAEQEAAKAFLEREGIWETADD